MPYRSFANDGTRSEVSFLYLLIKRLDLLLLMHRLKSYLLRKQTTLKERHMLIVSRVRVEESLSIVTHNNNLVKNPEGN